MSEVTLPEVVRYAAEKFGIPGLSVGVWADGVETYAAHGVTNLQDPQPIDQDTLYAVGSTSKPFAATALMHLVAQGKVELDAPVRRYIPELKLPNEQWTAEITVLNLLNHTAGLDWRLIVDTGDGDDALAEFIAQLSGFEQIAAPGTRASYSQVGFSIIARIIEKVTGMTFERAVEALVLEPLGLANTLYALDEIMAEAGRVGPQRRSERRTRRRPRVEGQSGQQRRRRHRLLRVRPAVLGALPPRRRERRGRAVSRRRRGAAG